MAAEVWQQLGLLSFDLGAGRNTRSTSIVHENGKSVVTIACMYI